MECAYYLAGILVDGTWNVPTTLTFVGCVYQNRRRESAAGRST
jgi:hypothetical protein